MANRLFPADAVAGAPSYSGRALRQSMLAPLLAGATAARPLGAISGVRPGTPDTTVTATSTTWTVKPHAGVLDVETAVEAGPYGYAIDANVTGAVTAAHATYTRWDGIYVQLSDPAEGDGTAAPGVAVVYVAGVPAAAPAMPAQPARSILLARIVVPKSGSGAPSVVWLAPIMAVAGGVRHYNSVGDLPARDAAIPNPTAGIVAVIGTGADYAEYVWTGAAWIKERGYLTATLGTAGLAIGSVTLTPTLVTNELGASVSGTAITGLPPGRYYLSVVARVDLVGATWAALGVVGSGVGDIGAEVNAPAGYNMLSANGLLVVPTAGSTITVTVGANVGTSTLRQPATLTLVRL